MAFSDFFYPDVLAKLDLTETSANLFGAVAPIAPSEALRSMLPGYHVLATSIHTEKARSEFLVAPLLAETWMGMRGRINFYSGVDLQADPQSGLTGPIDYLFGLGQQLPRSTSPFAVFFQAKRDCIPDGFGQCIAAMVGAQRAAKNQSVVYGAVTTGTSWRFLTLLHGLLTFDTTEYTIHPLDKLLGILRHIGESAKP